jgi:threonine synthase
VRNFCISSTGNNSTALAHGLHGFPDMNLYLFTASGFVDRVDICNSSQVIHFSLNGASFVEAFQFAREFAIKNGFVSERGFFNPGRREGLKLAFLEAAEQVPAPIDCYVQAVSSAMGVYGIYKGATELLRLGKTSRLPRLLCVQQDTCAPMVRAWQAGSAVIRPQDIVHAPSGIAKAILRGDPSGAYPHVYRIVKESGGDITEVDEAQIRGARKMAEELEGLSPCFSASAALAGLARLAGEGAVRADEIVLVNLTGSDRPAASDPSAAQQLARTGATWLPAEPVNGHIRDLF